MGRLFPVSTRAHIGFLGGGQLARMSIQAAQRMGLRCLSLDKGAGTAAGQIAPAIDGALNDPEAIAELLRSCEYATLENEFIPAAALTAGMERAGFDPTRLTPRVDTLATIQDKFTQRQAYAKAGVPSPKACLIRPGEPLSLPFPLVIKSRFGGYDGKGTWYARSEAEFEVLRDVWTQPHALHAGEPGFLAEEFVPFRRELAVMVYRDAKTTGAYPTMETVQTNSVCDLVFPCDADGTEVAIAAVEAVEGYGLFGVELFETNDGKILVNEIAPRPHNTGHYTLDWGDVSQFEMHVRLTMRLPVPATVNGQPVCMANLLAPEIEDFNLPASIGRALSEPGIHVHWYGKSLRKGRKVGHINATRGDIQAAAIAARERFWGI